MLNSGSGTASIKTPSTAHRALQQINVVGISGQPIDRWTAKSFQASMSDRKKHFKGSKTCFSSKGEGDSYNSPCRCQEEATLRVNSPENYLMPAQRRASLINQQHLGDSLRSTLTWYVQRRGG